MGTSAETTRLFERLTENLTAVSTQQASIVERLEDLKNGLELVASNLESSKTQQTAALAVSEASLADLRAKLDADDGISLKKAHTGELTQFAKFHPGTLSKADQEHFEAQYTTLSTKITNSDLYYDQGLRHFTSVGSGKESMKNIADLRSCVDNYAKAHQSHKARKILNTNSYHSYIQGHNKMSTWINTAMSNLWNDALKSIIGTDIKIAQLVGFQSNDKNSQGKFITSSWNEVPTSFFREKEFIKNPISYMFKTKTFMSRNSVLRELDGCLKYDKDINESTLPLHCIPMNFGDRMNGNQPCYIPLCPMFDDYRNQLYEAAMLLSQETLCYAPMKTMIPGDVNFDKTEHLDLTDFNESDTRVSENFHSYLNSSFKYLAQKDKSELLEVEMSSIRRITMGCKSYTLAQWVLAILCGQQQPIIMRLVDYRDAVLDTNSGAFSEFPHLDPNNIPARSELKID